jgi:uncharacterized membrane protein YwaF
MYQNFMVVTQPFFFKNTYFNDITISVMSLLYYNILITPDDGS